LQTKPKQVCAVSFPKRLRPPRNPHVTKEVVQKHKALWKLQLQKQATGLFANQTFVGSDICGASRRPLSGTSKMKE
jgi:hypothetical protein